MKKQKCVLYLLYNVFAVVRIKFCLLQRLRSSINHIIVYIEFVDNSPKGKEKKITIDFFTALANYTCDIQFFLEYEFL